MSNYKDFRNKNTQFTGTAGIDVSVGTTAQRDTGFGSGTLRFNSTTNLMEYYTGTDWKAIDAPPTITNFAVDGGSDVTTYEVDNEGGGTISVVIAGSLFDTTSATVSLIATSGSNISPTSTTLTSTNSITAVFTEADFTDANGPYSLKVTNGSGLAATLADAFTADQAAPSFINAADTTYTVFDSQRSSGTIAASDLCGATDPDNDSITYSVSTGSLPTGFTLNTSTGAITWSSVSAVGSDTTTTFTISADDGTNAASTRQFKIKVAAPTITTFNSPGTFTVPTGLTSVDVLVVAGGGGAGGFGGGGAGGLIYRPAMPISPGTPISVTVGSGGGQSQGGQSNAGQDSVFSTLTAKGGGGGGQSGYGTDLPGNQNVGNGGPGGSGGGGGHPNDTSYGGSGAQGGPGIQPSQPGESGQYGFGNNGGQGRNNVSPNSFEPQSTGGGGGGAGGVGGDGNAQSTQHGGAGGVGKAYSISGSSVYYAGGGGGSYGGEPGTGGGGPANTTTAQNAGTANRGGGGGTRYSGGNDQGGAGGSGVVIVSY